MLSIRWIIPAGGVFLVVALLTLAFITLSRSHISGVASAHTAINIELNDSPEWRRFIVLSAIQRRADELNRLRVLPDRPARTGSASTPDK